MTARVVDEPFYAAYLARSGADHPMREQILASQPAEPAAVIADLQQPTGPFVLQYQKQMTHHIVFDLDPAWLGSLQHAFLIRDPAAMIASYLNKMSSVTADDLGMARQRQLYDDIAALTGIAPPVIDAADVLGDPPAMLARLCTALGVRLQRRHVHLAARAARDGRCLGHRTGMARSRPRPVSQLPARRPPPLHGQAAHVLAACEPGLCVSLRSPTSPRCGLAATMQRISRRDG